MCDLREEEKRNQFTRRVIVFQRKGMKGREREMISKHTWGKEKLG